MKLERTVKMEQKDNYGNITEEMIEKWREKLAVIKEAEEKGIIKLYPGEKPFLQTCTVRVETKGLSRKESRWLMKIYNRIE
jgi:hypothetical protein